ncbi:MAG: PKD domain-containing protein [Archaeoglobaceae archaeon]
MSPPRTYFIAGRTAIKVLSFTLLFIFFVFTLTATVSATTLHVYSEEQNPEAKYNNIQDAVDDAASGDTIIVNPGVYTSVTLDKKLTLQGEDYPQLSSATINADNCVVKGFTFYRSYNGITVNSDKNRIENNMLLRNSYGIKLSEATGNLLINNIVESNSKGIFLELSPHNNILSNNVNHNGEGITLDNSDNNLVEDNTIVENSQEGLFLIFSWGNKITDNKVVSNSKSIFMQGSSYNTLAKNTFHTGSYGVALIDYNPTGGEFIPSKENKIYLNNIENNDIQAASYSSNVWNSKEAFDYVYNGNQSTSELGNYWSDISGNDYDDDGIMDTNGYYIDDQNKDNYPLSKHWETYFDQVYNLPPDPDFNLPSSSVIAGEQVEFEADSSDFDGSITSYEWSFGDGNSGSGSVTAHAYSDPGTYTVQLTVTDNNGESNSIAKVVNIDAPDTSAPSIRSISPSNGTVISEKSVTVSMRANEDLSDAFLNWDGSNIDMDGSGRSWSREVTDLAEGEHTFYVSAWDLAENKGQSEERTVIVDTVPPDIGFLDPTPDNGEEINKSWTLIKVKADESISSAKLNWNGANYTMNTEEDSRYYNFTGLSNGDYVYKVYAKDIAGNWGETEDRLLTVNTTTISEPPVANFSYSPSSPQSGQTVSFTDESFHADDGSIEKWSWDFGDGSSSNDKGPTHAYSSQGEYTVRLSVTDDDGDVNSTSKTVNVTQASTEDDNETNSGGSGGGGGGGGGGGIPSPSVTSDTNISGANPDATSTPKKLRTPPIIPWTPVEKKTAKQSAPSLPKSSTSTPPINPTQTEESFEGPQGLPGFEAVFAIGGLLTVAYLLRRGNK